MGKIILNRFSEDKFLLYIDDTLHLSFKKEGFVGVQSWFEVIEKYGASKIYFIEYYFTNSDPIFCEYDSRETWEAILKQLETI